MNDDRYQAIVVGAGLVGAATALALGRQGLRVALIERAPPTAPAENWDTRIYAISPTSQRFLATIGAWARLDTTRVQPVYRMDVAGDTTGELRLDAYAAGTAQLAHIVESGRLQHALWQAIQTDGHVDVYCPAAINTLERDGDYTRIALGDGRMIETQLVIGADGAHSRIRDWAGLDAVVTPYGQHGVVANFECERPHRGTAFQWFFESDILAWLPLSRLTARHDVVDRRPPSGGNCLSMVWSTQTAHADALLSLDAEALCTRVRDTGHARLGELVLLTPAAGFPLNLMRVVSAVAPGIALVGDAAHGVHPLAGQGVNLGFGDAEALVAVLAAHRRVACGDLRVLQRYARVRAEPVARMQAFTHGLHHVFADARTSQMRNVGMNVLNRMSPLKAALVREAMA